MRGDEHLGAPGRFAQESGLGSRRGPSEAHAALAGGGRCAPLRGRAGGSAEGRAAKPNVFGNEGAGALWQLEISDENVVGKTGPYWEGGGDDGCGPGSGDCRRTLLAASFGDPKGAPKSCAAAAASGEKPSAPRLEGAEQVGAAEGSPCERRRRPPAASRPTSLGGDGVESSTSKADLESYPSKVLARKFGFKGSPLATSPPGRRPFRGELWRPNFRDATFEDSFRGRLSRSDLRPCRPRSCHRRSRLFL